MPEEEVEQIQEKDGKGKSKMMLILIVALVVIIVAVVGAMTMMKDDGNQVQVAKPVAEYVVKERMYQLKDGSYLRLSFSIVVDADKVENVQEILVNASPGRLPDSIHMLLGNKTRQDLISGSHKREAFAREVKRALEEQVFNNFNKSKNPSEMIEVRDILINEYVTQQG